MQSALDQTLLWLVVCSNAAIWLVLGSKLRPFYWSALLSLLTSLGIAASLLGTFVSPPCNQGEIKGGKNSIEHKLAFRSNNGIEVTKLSLPVLLGQVEESILSLVGVVSPYLKYSLSISWLASLCSGSEETFFWHFPLFTSSRHPRQTGPEPYLLRVQAQGTRLVAARDNLILSEKEITLSGWPNTLSTLQ